MPASPPAAHIPNRRGARPSRPARAPNAPPDASTKGPARRAIHTPPPDPPTQIAGRAPDKPRAPATPPTWEDASYARHPYAFPHLRHRFLRARERAPSVRRDLVQPARPSLFGFRRKLPRPHQALRFQPVERGVHGADGGVAARTGFDLPAHFHAVRGFLQPQHRQHHHLLELSQELALRHFYKIESATGKVK